MVISRMQKIRLRGDRKFHDAIVKDLFADPSLLGIQGLDNNSVVWKKNEYLYMYSGRYREKGEYEKFASPDLVFFYYDNVLRFLVVEVKGSLLGKSHMYAEDQLARDSSCFRGSWRDIMIKQIKPDLIKQFTELPSTDVLLSLAEVTKEFGKGVYRVLPFGSEIYIGRLRLINNFIYFN